jgi:hypothetical protein
MAKRRYRNGEVGGIHKHDRRLERASFSYAVEMLVNSNLRTVGSKRAAGRSAQDRRAKAELGALSAEEGT